MARTPWILGIGASHNGSACLLHGDELVVAIQEERLTRRKRARIFGARPCLAIPYCLRAAGIEPGALEIVAISVQGHASAPEHRVEANPTLRGVAEVLRIIRVSHHRAHAVSAFASSGFEEAAVLVADGMGSPAVDLDAAERAVCSPDDSKAFESISLYHATRNGLVPLEKHMVSEGHWLIPSDTEMARFRSLGGMFSAVALQLFGDAMEAGKVMGLAPYGEPSIPIEEFLTVDGSHFSFHDRLAARFPHRRRWPENAADYASLASSVQRALEFALLHLAARIRSLTDCENLCFAGGVALNSVANERLIREGGFKRIHIPPAAEDSGTSVGAAYEAWRQLVDRYATRAIRHDSVGAPYSEPEVRDACARTPAIREVAEAGDIADQAADMLAKGHIGGWFQGGSELGPRALGQRSILADPRSPHGKEQLNARVKHREPFRPFAPAVLAEHAADWFALGDAPADSPFMLRVVDFLATVRSRVPAVVHVDGTGRLQTVARDELPLLHELISRFFARTQVPILLNTSFNVMGEPIVETPDDALWCLLATGLDFCVIGDRLVVKAEGYESVLDLVPKLGSARYLGIESRPAAPGAAPTGPRARFVVATPWGETEQAIDPILLAPLALVDGQRTGREIASRLAPTGPFDDAAMVRAISELRRARILAFEGWRATKASAPSADVER